MIYGYIYCFSNESMPGILKIGMTERTPNMRLDEANSSSTWKPPTPYKIEFAKKVLNPKEKESSLHNLFSTERVNPNREFFRISSEKVKLMFNLMDGELWLENQLTKNETEVLEEIKENNFSNIIETKHKTKKDTISKTKFLKQLKQLEIDSQEDIIMKFITETIYKTDDDYKLKKYSLANDFKIWWGCNEGGGRYPKLEKLYDCMDKKFGKYEDGWCGFKIGNWYDEVSDDENK